MPFVPFTDLNVGFSNAENYQRPENRELLSKYFVKDEFLDRLLDPSVFFLVGEKGTGKTAYATFLSNSDYKKHRAKIFDVRQTEYLSFLELKRQGHLPLSQYVEIWRTLLLIASATTVIAQSGTPDFLKRFTKLNSLKKAIDEFYDNAFAPELVKMIDFMQSSERASSLIVKHAGLGANVGSNTTSETRTSDAIFQINLLKIRQAFEAALNSLKLEQNVLIFIDGIDVRPGTIGYEDYFECVQGLVEAVWAINNNFLCNIKDSPGRIRIVLSVRPDIFLHTSIHNANTKLRDNSLFLNWMTEYKDHKASSLYKIADKLLSVQQSGQRPKEGESWNYYFPFHAENVTYNAGETGVNSFLAFLRFSYYRPRDVNSMIGTIQDIIKKKRGRCDYVTAEDFNDPSFRNAHAEYLLGEIRDQLLFYYSQNEYDLFLQFFSYLRGKIKFSYEEYITSFNEFIIECRESEKQLPKFFHSATAFLQFLYEQNVICYKERVLVEHLSKKPFFRWCFRERTLSNMAPKVRQGVEYEIFYGLTKALNIGRRVRVTKPILKREIGTIISFDPHKSIGFIRGGDKQLEYYFQETQFTGEKRPRVSQKVSYEIVVKYGKPRATAVRLQDRRKPKIA